MTRPEPFRRRDPVGMDDRPFAPPEAYAAGPRIIRPAPVRTSRFFAASELDGQPVPPREWLVPDMVPAATVTLFGGDGGTGKSLLALQLAVAAATGTGWLGRPVTPSRAIFLTAEDDEPELHRRLDAILAAARLGYRQLDGLTLRSLAGEDALLALETQVALLQSTLFDELERRAEAEAPGLIVIDTAADVYPSNENDRCKVRQFVGILRGLAIRRRCAVVLLTHPSLSGISSGTGLSGSTAWNNSVRSRLYLARIADDGHEPDPDARILSVKKANYGPIGAELGLRWRNGVFEAEAQETGLDKLAAEARAQRVFLKLLSDFNRHGRHVSPARSVTYAPAVFAKHPQSEGVRKRAFELAMEKLLASGRIVIASHGRGASQRQHLEVAQ